MSGSLLGKVEMSVPIAEGKHQEVYKISIVNEKGCIIIKLVRGGF